MLSWRAQELQSRKSIEEAAIELEVVGLSSEEAKSVVNAVVEMLDEAEGPE